MVTECNGDALVFQASTRREVVDRFDGGAITSDGGGVLPRPVEQRTGILQQCAACFTDHRKADRTEHTAEALIAQRIYGLALGHEDLNDHDELRRGPLLATLVAKAEYLPKGENPRFVVTSLSAEDRPAAVVYEQDHCGRGDMENRIEEQRLLPVCRPRGTRSSALYPLDITPIAPTQPQNQHR